MMKEKVTREDLRSFQVGEERQYELPTPQACQSAAVSANQMKPEGMCFTCNQKRKLEGIIIITRTA